MKILMIIADINYGAGKMMTTVGEMLINRGHKVYLLTYLNNTRKNELDSRIVHLQNSALKKGIKNNYIRKIREIKKAIKNVNPDVTLSFLTDANMMNIIASKICHTPSIISERGDPNTEDSLKNRIKKFFYNFTDCIVFQSNNAAKFYNKRIQKKGVIIPNYIIKTSSNKTNILNRASNVIVVGRLDNFQKRQDLAITALKNLHEEFPELKFLFAGDGPDKEKLKSIVSSLSLEEAAIFMGRVKNVSEIMDKNKYFLLTSDFEGMPNSLMEAMDAGMIVVTTDFSPGNAKEMIFHGVDGFIVDRDNPKQISDLLRKLLNHEFDEIAISQKATKITEKFNKEIIENQWENVFLRYQRNS